MALFDIDCPVARIKKIRITLGILILFIYLNRSDTTDYALKQIDGIEKTKVRFDF